MIENYWKWIVDNAWSLRIGIGFRQIGDKQYYTYHKIQGAYNNYIATCLFQRLLSPVWGLFKHFVFSMLLAGQRMDLYKSRTLPRRIARDEVVDSNGTIVDGEAILPSP